MYRDFFRLVPNGKYSPLRWRKRRSEDNVSKRTQRPMKLAIAAFLLLTLPATAGAYVDPGTGAFVYQATYAAVLGGMYYFRQLIDRIWGRRK